MSISSYVQWTEDGAAHCARWHSESGFPAPKRVITADDTMTADDVYGMACQGISLLWRGDYHNARQMLTALGSRADRHHRKPKKKGHTATPLDLAQTFHLHRQARAQRARTLGALLVQLNESYNIALRRAPIVRDACTEAFGPAHDDSHVMSLRTLLGVIGAHQWYIKGVEIPAARGRIHPCYGVFAPIRSEYLDLVSSAPLPGILCDTSQAFDIGTGTGVIAAILARRGIKRVVATDVDPRALACARENLERLGVAKVAEVIEADLFPVGRAALVVCNPPWIPARPSSTLERGIYDPDGRMLGQFLQGLPSHLEPEGEGWLILSDLAEHLGLRSREQLLKTIDAAGLTVLERHDIRPTHPKSVDATDPLHLARAAEVTSLWRLAARAKHPGAP